MQIDVSNTLTVTNPTKEMLMWCNKNLSIPNPEYAKKARMNLWLGNTPRTLHLYETHGDKLVLPFGVLRSLPKEITDNAVFTSVFAPPVAVRYEADVPLYDYQETAVQAMIDAKYGILQSAAGSGKTQMGKFTDLYIGDYWTINGVNYRIAAFDYYLNCGDTDTTKHHVVIVPDTCLYNHVMNDTNITTGGYVGSKMYKEGLEQAKTTIKTAFSGHVLKHRVYLTNAVANGRPSAGAWCDSEVDLMCEEMVYGGGIFRPTSDGSSVPANYRVEKSQLPLFAHEPSRICNRATWWLRDVVSASFFAFVSAHGYAYYGGASLSRGVRPAFCIS